MRILRSRPSAVFFVATAATVFLGGCSSSHKALTTTTSTGASSTSTSTSTSAPTTSSPILPTTSLPPTSTPASTVPPSSSTSLATTTTESVCEQRATETYVHVIAATETPSGGLNLSGNPATLVCGGPDDYHYNVSTTVEAVLVVPGATIEVLPLTEGMQEQKIPASQLSGYLKTDTDTRIFLVTGPLSGVTELQEQFHP